MSVVAACTGRADRNSTPSGLGADWTGRADRNSGTPVAYTRQGAGRGPHGSRLDRASLSAKRKLTIPFVKQALEW